MKHKYSAILVISVILIAMAVAGCCAAMVPGSPAASATPDEATDNPDEATTVPAGTGGPDTLGAAIDFDKVHWFEYRITGGTGRGMTEKMREDFNVDYEGQKADKIAITGNSSDGSSGIAIEAYQNHTSHRSLGGTMKTLQDGRVVNTVNVPASGQSGSSSPWPEANIFSANANARLSRGGPSSVIVPAGTYDATEYTLTDTNGNSGKVWIDSGVPTPVKYESGIDFLTMDMDLTGWG